LSVKRPRRRRETRRRMRFIDRGRRERRGSAMVCRDGEEAAEDGLEERGDREPCAKEGRREVGRWARPRPIPDWEDSMGLGKQGYEAGMRGKCRALARTR
jgi:hypothetical protein